MQIDQTCAPQWMIAAMPLTTPNGGCLHRCHGSVDNTPQSAGSKGVQCWEDITAQALAGSTSITTIMSN